MNRLVKLINEEIENHFNEQLNVSDLENISVKSRVPQVQLNKKIYTPKIDNKIIVDDREFKSYKKYDFIVTVDGQLIVGDGHYKLSKKANEIKGAGELIVDDDGKIIYLSNESGHYQPTNNDLKNVANKFNKLSLLSNDVVLHDKY